MRRGFAVFVVILCGLLVCGCGTIYDPPVIKSITPSSYAIPASFFKAKQFGVSPDVSAQEGYATNGVNNFLFGKSKIVETDSAWTQTYVNAKPFAGMTGMTLDHLGDGEVSNGYIYDAIACSSSDKSCGARHKAIAVYAANTVGLPLVNWADITSSSCDAESGLAVGPNNTLYVASFYVNPSQLCLFDATTLEPKGTLTLSTPIPYVQGISYNAAAQQFAVSSDSASKIIGYIYFVSLSGEVSGPYLTPQKDEVEGLDYTQGYIGYDVSSAIQYIFPFQVAGSNFKPGAVVYGNALDRQTFYQNSGSLISVVKATTMSGFGAVKIKVVNPGLLGGTSNTVKFTVSAASN
jgi:hypothetical protein